MVYNPSPEEDTSLDSAILEMDVIAQQHAAQSPVIGHVKGLLESTRERLSSGELSKEEACQYLFDVYFEFQPDVQDTPLAGILRVVGDDLGHQLGLDSDAVWSLYQRSLNNTD